MQDCLNFVTCNSWLPIINSYGMARSIFHQGLWVKVSGLGAKKKQYFTDDSAIHGCDNNSWVRHGTSFPERIVQIGYEL